ncbi:hypothetical protein [Mangrovimonas aestuarii]|uniref:hypothetical protein n=1 Tax=Mangrovimonas aestuarii TaxID=3018443 RepID=UPI002379962A|nr:hypothetical protein [Mangrovimonas aestuarii]
MKTFFPVIIAIVTIFLVVFIISKKENQSWSQLSPTQRKARLVLLVFGLLFFVIGILFYMYFEG